MGKGEIDYVIETENKKIKRDTFVALLKALTNQKVKDLFPQGTKSKVVLKQTVRK